MSQSLYEKNQQLLYSLIEQADLDDLLELSKLSGVSQWQLNRLQHGLIGKISVENIAALAKTLNLSIEQFLKTFIPYDGASVSANSPAEEAMTIANLKQEYANLQKQMQQQQEILKQEFQQESLQAIESWLLQWPTAAAAVRKNSQRTMGTTA